ncbi:TPA: hypothetical protein KRE78_002571 [Clostridioides difficile]|nr:hypothetical protein [Clostridioides difficile]
MSKIIKETKYCKVIRQAKLRHKDIVYGIEKIIVKEVNQEEIRFVYFKNTIRMKEQLVPRPLDLPEKDLIQLIGLAIKHNVFSKEFINGLKEIIK